MSRILTGGGKVGPEGYLRLAKGLGAQYTFTKPFQMQVVLKAIQELLEK